MQAHSAPLGIAFYSGAEFPEENITIICSLPCMIMRIAANQPATKLSACPVAMHRGTRQAARSKILRDRLAGCKQRRRKPPSRWSAMRSQIANVYLSDDKAGLIYRINIAVDRNFRAWRHHNDEASLTFCVPIWRVSSAAIRMRITHGRSNDIGAGGSCGSNQQQLKRLPGAVCHPGGPGGGSYFF